MIHKHVSRLFGVSFKLAHPNIRSWIRTVKALTAQ